MQSPPRNSTCFSLIRNKPSLLHLLAGIQFSFLNYELILSTDLQTYLYVPYSSPRKSLYTVAGKRLHYIIFQNPSKPNIRLETLNLAALIHAVLVCCHRAYRIEPMNLVLWASSTKFKKKKKREREKSFNASYFQEIFWLLTCIIPCNRQNSTIEQV